MAKVSSHKSVSGGRTLNDVVTSSSSSLLHPSPGNICNPLKMSSLIASAIAISAKRPPESECRGQIKILGPVPVGLYRQSLSFGRRQAIAHTRKQSASLICASALNARCGAEQTQTVTRQSSTITIAPIQGKEKSPELDDGGTGFPPRDDGDGGGGGGGGGGGWAGGFFFFGFLAFLGFLKDKESEGPYRDER